MRPPAPAEPAPGSQSAKDVRPEPDISFMIRDPQSGQQPSRSAPPPVAPAPKPASDPLDFDSLEAEMSRLLGRDPQRKT
jgi:hypothetical protein